MGDQLQFGVVRVAVGSAEVRRRTGDVGDHKPQRLVCYEPHGVNGERQSDVLVMEPNRAKGSATSGEKETTVAQFRSVKIA